MPTALDPSNYPNEGGVLPLVLAFTDEAGDPLTLDTLRWSLRDGAGAIVNSREDVTLAPAASVALTLSGADLDIGSAGAFRLITLEGTFTSDLGAGLPWNHEITFAILNLRGV